MNSIKEVAKMDFVSNSLSNLQTGYSNSRDSVDLIRTMSPSEKKRLLTYKNTSDAQKESKKMVDALRDVQQRLTKNHDVFIYETQNAPSVARCETKRCCSN